MTPAKEPVGPWGVVVLVMMAKRKLDGSSMRALRNDSMSALEWKGP